MTKLLFIKASPRGANSDSIAIAQAYLDARISRETRLDANTIDLWDEDLPPFDGDRVSAKLAVMTGQEHSQRQRTAWDQTTDIAQRFMSADHYLFAVPMWNGGIPYRLKQYIDIVHQPGMLFHLDPKAGYTGLLRNKAATLVYTSGAFSPSAPSPAFGIDHHSTYMRSWLNQAGVTDLHEIRHQPTLLAADRKAGFERARQEAVSAAAAVRVAA